MSIIEHFWGVKQGDIMAKWEAQSPNSKMFLIFFFLESACAPIIHVGIGELKNAKAVCAH